MLINILLPHHHRKIELSSYFNMIFIIKSFSDDFRWYKWTIEIKVNKIDEMGLFWFDLVKFAIKILCNVTQHFK